MRTHAYKSILKLGVGSKLIIFVKNLVVVADSMYLKPDQNCWRVTASSQLAYLIDGQSYFQVLRDVLKEADSQILILSWDIDSRIPLIHEEVDDGLPIKLGEFLNEIVKRKPNLKVHILNWDFTPLFTAYREKFTKLQFDWKTHKRIIYRLDDVVPTGACHHQKVIVIDDTIAFCGGLDLTQGRWDTCSHTPNDSRRCDADGNLLRPYHDVQIMLEGDTAGALGDLARARWKKSQNEDLEKPKKNSKSLWPVNLEPDLVNAKAAITRTICSMDGTHSVREAEMLFHDSIENARDYIYIENQYFTADSIAQKLIKRLQEKDGPEVVLVLPKSTQGWIANVTMDVKRIQLINQLREHDYFGRFATYYAHLDGLTEDESINVHAKVMVIDQEFCRIGSSNLCNRSLGLDTECDIAIESTGLSHLEAGITRLRNRLLAEHLDTDPQTVAETIEKNGSLIKAIEHLRSHKSRSLNPLEPELVNLNSLEDITNRQTLVDPYEPLEPDYLMHSSLDLKERFNIKKRAIAFVVFLISLVGLVITNQFFSLTDYINLNEIFAYIESLDDNSGTALGLIILIYLVGGVFAVPVTILVVATVMIFGPVYGFIIAMVGTNLSAILVYWIGNFLGSELVRKFAGRKVNKISKDLAKRGILAMTLVRMVPVAPFSIVNLIAGVSHIKFIDYFFGTLFGMFPGLIAVVLITDRVEESIKSQSLMSILQLILVVMVIGIVGYIFIKKLLPKVKN